MKNPQDYDHISVAMDIVEENGSYLVLRKAEEYRENRKRYMENAWEIPGGKISEELDDEGVRQGALRELREETGLEGAADKVGEPYDWEQEGTGITFHPVLIRVESREVTLSEEHDRYEWVEPGEFPGYATEQEMEAFNRVAPEEVDV